MDYKKLYEQKCMELDQLCQQFESLKVDHVKLQTTNRKQKVQITNSQTAKNGYKEERFVCEFLNSKEVPEKYRGEETHIPVPGVYKSDIQSSDGKFKAQVKKYKQRQFQQVDRHWVKDYISNIPEWEKNGDILKNLCEIPLSADGKHVDKSQRRKILSTKNYSEQELQDFLQVLENGKKTFLKYIFQGTVSEHAPEYIIGVEYDKKIRKSLTIYKISDVIDYLSNSSFTISKRKTVICLGDCLSLQRKGGDAGRKGGNQLQCKLIFSRLKIKEHFYHRF